MSRFHDVTEGSPTFASSVLRLVSLGENLEQALLKWKNADGEDVRRFAFNKELDELPDSTRNVLFALCVLSESTLAELSEILSRSIQQVRDDFAELRKYHLIGQTEANLPGGAKIAVPGSIRMMKEILRGKVRDHKKIEGDCARARSSTIRIRSEVGSQINRITSLWDKGEFGDALDVALNLDQKYKNEADLKCLLGRAYQVLPNPDYKKSEIYLRKADELSCKRPELLPLWVEAKSCLGDWTGLLQITVARGDSCPMPEFLLARAEAYRQLAALEFNSGGLRNAARHYAAAGKEINDRLKVSRYTKDFLQLRQARKDFLIAHVDIIDKITSDPNDYIDVWLATVLSFECFVRAPRILRLGAEKLYGWWMAVERRDTTAESSARLLKVQLATLRRIVKTLNEQESPDMELISDLGSFDAQLEDRLARYDA